MAEKTISVITPVWNQSHWTNRYLIQHCERYGDAPGVEFIIIDNGSADGTPELLKQYQQKMSNLKVITNDQNEGFPIACNQGAKVASGEVLLFLNNDVVILGDYISIIRQHIADDMLLGPELNTHNTGWNEFNGVRVPYIAGWCIGITKDTFDKLGGFDERYSPCDYEDIDLCYTAKKAGMTFAWITLPIRHQSGGSAMEGRQMITEANRLKFAEKWEL